MHRLRSYIIGLLLIAGINLSVYPTPFFIDQVNSTDITCFGGTDGTGTVISIIGGTAPFSYQWKYNDYTDIPGETDSTVTGLSKGFYWIYIEDADGDWDDYQIEIADGPLLKIDNITKTDITCNGYDDGMIEVSASGGHGGFQYSIDNQATFQSNNQFTGLSSGSYDIWVMDSEGCTREWGLNPVAISEPSSVTVSIDGTSNLSLTCYGDTDGAIDISVGGGTPGYSYSWTGPAGYTDTIEDIGSLGVGKYVVTVTDTNSCEEVDSATVTSPPEIDIQVDSANDISCNGLNDGSIGVTISGGVPKAGGPPDYDYSWTGDLGYSSSDEDIAGLVADNYTLAVTDDAGCTRNSGAIPITEPMPITVTNDDTVNVSCNGDSDGGISVSIGGGTFPYDPLWSGPAGYSSTSENLSGLTAGAYSLLVTDASGCTYNHPSIDITEPPVIDVSIDTTSKLNLSCYGDADGEIDITATGGVSPLAFSWTGPGGFNDTSEDITGLDQGDYSLLVTDSLGCTMNYAPLATIVEPAQLALTLASDSVSCFGDNDGSIIAHATGGTPAYEFSKDASNWQSDSVFTNLDPGGHIIFARGQNHCTPVVFNTAVIYQPQNLYISSELKVDSNNICFGDSNGKIIITAGGGTPPLEYSIDSGMVFSSSSVFTGLPAGEYRTILRDSKGCTKTGNNNLITEPPEIVITSYSQDDISSCSYANEGRIVITAAGGEGTRTYTLDSSVMNIFGIFDTLYAGSHLVTIQDEKGCVKDTSVILAAPPPIAFDSTNIVDASGCFGDSTGTLYTLASGGTGTMHYALDGGSLQDSGKWTGLPGGQYLVSAIDDNSCIHDTTLEIIQSDSLGYSNLSAVPIVCRGEDNASISITASGGTPPYTFTLMPGGSNNATGLFQDLSPGAYTVTIAGSGGCPDVTTDTIAFANPPAISFDSVVSTVISCHGADDGTIMFYALGGVAPLKYSIDGGSTFLPQFKQQNLSPADYRTVVQDANGCRVFGDTVTLTDPDGLNIDDPTGSDVTCFGDSTGSVSVSASGGTAPLEYSLDESLWQGSGTFNGVPAGTYRVYVRDANTCGDSSNTITLTHGPEIFASISTVKSINGLPGEIHISSSGGVGNHEYSVSGTTGPFQSDTSFTSLWPDVYDVVVRDENLCTHNEPVILEAEPPLLIDITHTNNPCWGDSTGTITFSSVNGIQPVTYSIDGGASFAPDSEYTALGSGTYYLQALDGDMRKYWDTLEVEQPLKIMIAIDSLKNIACFGNNDGIIMSSVSDAVFPVTYNWTSDGGFNSSDSVLTGLSEDVYYLEVSGSDGCTVQSDPVEITGPSQISVSTDSLEDISCFGNKDGAIYITVSGGNSPYSVLWNGPSGYQSTSWDITGLDAGDYQLVVQDAMGCNLTPAPVAISEPDSLSINVAGTSVLSMECAGAMEGKIDVDISGGMPSYSFLWSGPAGFTALSEDVSGLGGGTYRLVVIDANGCSKSSGDIDIEEPAGISSNGSTSPATCYGTSFDGSISLAATGGMPPFRYLWSNGDTTSGITNLDAGEYSVTITDANDCELMEDFSVASSSPVRARAGNDTTICAGEMLILNGRGGDVYLWQPSTGLSNPNIPNPVATVTGSMQYILTVSDALCIDADTITIGTRPVPVIDAGQDTTVAIGQVIQLMATGADFKSYAWNPASGLDNPSLQDPMLTVTQAVLYFVTGTDDFGCTATDSIQISVPEGLVVYSGFTPNGDGINDTWDIDNTEAYPDILVEVYNRWGKLIFSSRGYSDADRWDGTYNGEDVQTGTYYYVISGQSETTRDRPLKLTGTVTIVR